MILRPLRILSLNIRRANYRIHSILNSDIYNDFDIVLIQDPYFDFIGIARSQTIATGTNVLGAVISPAWDIHYPSGAGNPRALTYVRKDIPQLSASTRPDILWHHNAVVLEVKYGHRSFMLYNIYNPHGEINPPNSVLEALIETEPKLHLPTVVAGDFNLHHPDW
jgi:hypothetical protein